MSEANLKQAFRNLVKAHIAHAASGRKTKRNSETFSQRYTFQQVLQQYINKTVTHDMRLRYLLNKNYVTNVNKNYLVSQLKTTALNNLPKSLRGIGYYVGDPNKNTGKRSIRTPVGAGVRKVQKSIGSAGETLNRIPGTAGTGLRKLLGPKTTP
jgi:hypothetical protein